MVNVNVDQQNQSAFHVPIWTWPNVLSLDAVVIGLLWQIVFTTQFLQRLPAHYELGIIGLSIWLVYTADRLLDSIRLNPERPHALRHRFHLEYRTILCVAWFIVLAADTLLIISFADESQLRWGCAAVAVVVAYVMGVQISQAPTRSIPKELQAGMAFAFGVSLPCWSELDSSVNLALLVSTLMTGLLFASNCLAIAYWEREWDANQSFHSSVTRFPAVDRWLPAALLVHAAVAVGLLAAGLLSPLVAACMITSGLLILGLLVLNRARESQVRDSSTSSVFAQSLSALADAAIAIPAAGFVAAGVIS